MTHTIDRHPAPRHYMFCSFDRKKQYDVWTIHPDVIEICERLAELRELIFIIDNRFRISSDRSIQMRLDSRKRNWQRLWP